MKKNVSFLFLILTTFLSGVRTGLASGIWLGSTGEWTDAACWSGGHVPSNETAIVQSGTSRVASSVFNSGYNNVQSNGTLEILAGGVFPDTNRFYVGGQNAVSGTGTVTVSAGVLRTTGAVVLGGSSNSQQANTGVVNISGGSWTNAGNPILVARKSPGSSGTINLSAGTLYSENDIVLGRTEGADTGGVARLNFTGGRLTVNAAVQDSGGKATVCIIGRAYGASISVGQMLLNETASTLALTITTNGVVPVVSVGDSVLAGALILTADGLKEADVGTGYPLLEVKTGTVLTNGLIVRSGGGAVFSVAKIPDGAGETLRAVLQADAENAVSYLQGKVSALPEATDEEALKKAVLCWTLKKAAAEWSAENLSAHAELVSDVDFLMDRSIGGAVSAPTNIVSRIQVTDGNPYWDIFKDFMAHANPLMNVMRADAWAVCSDQSPEFQNVMWMTNLFTVLDAGLSVDPQSYVDGNMVIFDAAQMFDTFYQLDSTYPGLLIPSLKSNWLSRLELYMDEIVASRGNPALNPRLHGLNYPNPDAHALLAVGIASRYFNKSDYQTYETNLLAGLEAHQYPDGAWSYLFNSNEEPAYHGVVLRGLMRYWEITGSDRVYRMLEKSVPYYPLSVEHGGVAEGSTSPYWKHRWDFIEPWSIGAVAGVTGDARNFSQSEALLAFCSAAGLTSYYSPISAVETLDILRVAASWYRTNITAMAAEDNYVKYDRNIEGSRGRFGDWSFTATGRDFDRDRGKYTFAGAMVLDNTNRLYPLSGALQIAMNRYYYDASGTNSYILGMADHNSMVMHPLFSVFCTEYNLQKPIDSGGYSIPQPWLGIQQWIMTPQRLVGFAQIKPDGAQTAYGLEGVLRLGNGRGLYFKRLPSGSLVSLSSNEYSYGRLRLKMVGHNYAKVIVTNAPSDYRGVSKDILLQDAVRAGGRAETTYPAATSNWYCIEVRPEDASPALDIQHWETSGVFYLYTKETSNRNYLVVHNTSGTNTVFDFSGVTNRLTVSAPIQYYLDDQDGRIAGTNGFSIQIPSMKQLTVVWGDLIDDRLDADENLLPDVWEVAHFGMPGVSAAGNEDGDTEDNISEYIAGTDPLNAASLFFCNIRQSSFGVEMGFQTVSAAGSGYSGLVRLYGIECRTNLLSGTWVSLRTNITASGDFFQTNILHTLQNSTEFYRANVRLKNENSE